MTYPNWSISCSTLVSVATLSIVTPSAAQVVINAPPTVIADDFDLNAGETLNVGVGGEVGRRFNANSGSVVNISGGEIGFFFSANTGSEVNISGGFVEFGFDANDGSVVNVSGGSVSSDFDARSGSKVNISGGSVFDGFEALPGSEVNISGGAIGEFFSAFSGSDVELIGGEFQLNGAEFTDGSITLADGDTFTGTLTDGSTFVFSPLAGEPFNGDALSSVILTQSALPAFDLTPMVVNAPTIGGPSGLRAGQSLTVLPGGQLGDNFAVVESTLNVDGGSVGSGAEVAGGLVNILGGEVGGFIDAHSGSRVNIFGGSVGATLGFGDLVSGFDALPGSEVNIFGGTVGEDFNAFSGSNVNLFGTAFRLDGVPLTNLLLGEASVISDRGGMTLTGQLADGSVIRFDLNTANAFGEDFFDADATLTVQLILPTTPGDANGDGVVNTLDINPFVLALTDEAQYAIDFPGVHFIATLDLNRDGVVNTLDIEPFVALLTGGGAGAPEPGAWGLVIFAAVAQAMFRGRER